MYRTIDTAIWLDPKFKNLPAPAKLFFFYLITNPHGHVSGIYYLPDVVILHETSLKQETLNTLWDNVSGAGLARRDQKSEVVWVRNMLKRQGSGEKNERSAANQLHSLDNCCLIKEFLNHYPAIKRYYKHRVSNRVSRVGIQEQEQEQEQENPPKPPKGGESAGAEKRDPKEPAEPGRKEPAESGREVIPEGFARFWSEWPDHFRKKSRSKCLRVWRAAKLEARAEDIITAVRQLKTSAQWAREQGQFIPGPLPWLNDEGWQAPPGPLAQDLKSANGKYGAPARGSITTARVFGEN